VAARESRRKPTEAKLAGPPPINAALITRCSRMSDVRSVVATRPPDESLRIDVTSHIQIASEFGAAIMNNIFRRGYIYIAGLNPDSCNREIVKLLQKPAT
jgi:hypothetical protein